MAGTVEPVNVNPSSKSRRTVGYGSGVKVSNKSSTKKGKKTMKLANGQVTGIMTPPVGKQ